MNDDPQGLDVGSVLGVESNVFSGPSPERGEADPRLAIDEATRYERRATLGMGGMGRVVIARDHRLDRDVALKEVVPLGDANALAQLEARLAREAAVTARLEHPNIVPVYDAGRGADGRLFYTMRVIRGRSLSDVVRATPSPHARLSLMRHVLDACQAVAWAHRHGIVHRDLKPANIMVGELGETQVVDWGLARPIMGHEAPLITRELDASLTQLGAAIGTPHYMAPEQAAGRPADARSDVWALGYVIAEVVSGEVAQPRLYDLPGELAAIVRRATMPAPDDRYDDAKALADDVAAWLDGRRVGAHAYSTWELVRRLVRAWRLPLAIVLVALIAVGVAVGIGFSETAAERDRAEAERQRAVDAEARTNVALARAERELGRALVGSARVSMLDDARPEAELTAVTALTHDDTPEARGLVASLFASARPTCVWHKSVPDCHQLTLTSDARLGLCQQQDALELWDLDTATRRWRVAVRTSWSSYLEGPRPLVLHTSGNDHDTTVRDATTGEVLPPMRSCCAAPRASRDGRVGFSPGLDHTMLVRAADDFTRTGMPCVIGSGDYAAGVTIAGCVSGGYVIAEDGAAPALRTLPLASGEHVTAVGMVPGQRAVVFGTNKGEVLLVALAPERVVRRSAGPVGVVAAVLVSADGGVVAVRDERAGIRIWDVATGAWRGRMPAHHDRGLRWLDDAPRRLVTWSDDEAVAWDIPADRPATLPLSGGVSGLDVVADRVALAAGTHVEVRALGTGETLLDVAEGVIVKSVALDARGARVAAGLAVPDRRVERLDLDGGRDAVGAAHFTRRIARLGDGFLRAPDWGPLTFIDRAGDEHALDRASVTSDLALSASGRYAAVLGGLGELRVLTFDPAPTVRAIASDVAWSAAAPSNDGELIACATDGGVALVDGAADLRAWLVAEANVPLVDVVWSADDRWLAAGGKNGAVYLWRVRDRTLRAVVRDHRERAAALMFDQAGGWLASGGWDATLRFIALAPMDKEPDELRRAVEAAWGMRYDTLRSR